MQIRQQYVLKFAPLCVEVERAFGMAKMDELSEEGKQVAKKALEAIVRKRGEFATACTMGGRLLQAGATTLYPVPCSCPPVQGKEH